MDILPHHIKYITGFRYNNIQKLPVFVAFIDAGLKNKLLDFAKEIVRIDVERSIQVGDFVCRQCHHLAQHIPIMDLFGVQVGFIQNIDTGERDTRVINNGFGKCHKSRDIHSVVGCEWCEFGGSFQDGARAAFGVATYSPPGGLEFRETHIIFLDNEPATFDFFTRDDR